MPRPGRAELMQAEELRELDAEELGGRLKGARRELFELRFKLAVGQLENPHQIRNVRREIARILTVVHERLLDEQVEQAYAGAAPLVDVPAAETGGEAEAEAPGPAEAAGPAAAAPVGDTPERVEAEEEEAEADVTTAAEPTAAAGEETPAAELGPAEAETAPETEDTEPTENHEPAGTAPAGQRPEAQPSDVPQAKAEAEEQARAENGTEQAKDEQA